MREGTNTPFIFHWSNVSLLPAIERRGLCMYKTSPTCHPCLCLLISFLFIQRFLPFISSSKSATLPSALGRHPVGRLFIRLNSDFFRWGNASLRSRRYFWRWSLYSNQDHHTRQSFLKILIYSSSSLSAYVFNPYQSSLTCVSFKDHSTKD